MPNKVTGLFRILDKMPLNLVDVGFINALFPKAKLIVALRDPRDVCLSCFMQPFQLNGAMKNYLSRERTVEFYANVMDLWLHLRDLITLPYIEVRYEKTVHDLEGQARRMLDFLGLEFHAAVLEFQEHARQKFITTPSFESVIEPVHSRAIGRWSNYASQMEHQMPKLQPFIQAFGYE